LIQIPVEVVLRAGLIQKWICAGDGAIHVVVGVLRRVLVGVGDSQEIAVSIVSESRLVA
jgi:hypothetical protein